MTLQMEESLILLNRLYNASKAYYLMKEESFAVEGATVKIHNELVKEEFVAALVAVKMITEAMTPEDMLAYHLDLIRHHTDRRKEWSAAKVLFNTDMGDYLEYEKKSDRLS
ncbi:hypothetical protein KAR91_03760 [Candidatus Pacearchaeota archaeon]|nr:hypothetical protein [Candidatus Pacearchaeota archaeon]